MGIEMYLGSSDQQAQSVSSVLGKRMNAYQSLQASLNQFILNSSSLSGQTYASAKAYSQQLLLPLLKGAFLVDEAITTACSQLPSQYRSQVDHSDLKEDELVEKIYTADMTLGRYMYLIELEYSKKKPNWYHLSNLRSSESNYRELKRQLEDKLQKLRTFNASSANLFSNIDPLIAAVQTGIRQANSSWNPQTKVFTIPPKSEMKWTETVEKWTEMRDARAYNLSVAKAESDEALTLDDIQAIYNYAQSHPDVLLSQKLLEAIKDFYKKNSTQLDVAATVIEQLGSGIRQLGGLITVLEGIKGPATTNAQGVSTSFIMVNPNGVGQAVVQNGSTVANVGKGIGYGLMGVGFGIGMYDDIVNHDMSVGEATGHNVLSTGVAWGASAGTSALIVWALGSNPVGWAAVGVAAVGFGAGYLATKGYEWLYENVDGVKDVSDYVGEAIIDSIFTFKPIGFYWW